MHAGDGATTHTTDPSARRCSREITSLFDGDMGPEMTATARPGTARARGLPPDPVWRDQRMLCIGFAIEIEIHQDNIDATADAEYLSPFGVMKPASASAAEMARSDSSSPASSLALATSKGLASA